VNELERAYRGFASPLEPLNEAFLDAVTVEHARQITRRFLRRFSSRIKKQSDGLVPALERWLSREAGFEDVWDLAFGRLRAALEENAPPDVLRRTAEAALRLAERGCPGEWEARFRRAIRLRIGRFLLPVADRLRVRADGSRLELLLSHNGRAKTLVFPQPVLRETAVDGVETLALVTAEGTDLAVLRRDALEAREFSVDLRRVDRRPDSIVGPLDAALRLIGKHSPAYLTWIQRISRQVLPLADDPTMMTSSSAAWRPGVLYSANRPDTAALAEMLVHEGSHQYMYILRQLGPLDDGSDQALYHSPVRGTLRPLGAMVVAYHAVANVTLFCRACPSGSRLRPRQTERSFAAALRPYEDVLRANPALTPIGRALWRPLYERLHGDAADDRVTANPGRGRARRAGSGSCRNTTSHRRTGRRTSCRTARPRGRAGQTLSTAPSGR
jgi:HEXXH motif-containing protein